MINANNIVQTSVVGGALTRAVLDGATRLTDLAEKKAAFETLVECYRVLAESDRETALLYISDRIREEAK